MPVHAHASVAPASDTEGEQELEIESGPESSVPSEFSPRTATMSDVGASPFAEGGSDAQKKNNFYPVTWRVVGGGVMMSGRREPCEAFMAGHCAEGADCRFAHPDTCESSFPSSPSLRFLPKVSHVFIVPGTLLLT